MLEKLPATPLYGKIAQYFVPKDNLCGFYYIAIDFVGKISRSLYATSKFFLVKAEIIFCFMSKEFNN